jgi:carbonic anhydrase
MPNIFWELKDFRRIRMPNLTNTICEIATQVSKNPCVTYLDNVQLHDGLHSDSIKNTAVVTCSDFGAHIPFLSKPPSSEFLLFQNFGHQFEYGGLVETLAGQAVENVVVYGHSDCVCMKHLAISEENGSAEDKEQLHLYRTAVESDAEADWEVVCQYNVLNEIKKMLVNPVIASLVASERLQIHGWFYNSASKQLEVFDPKQNAFIEAGCNV